MLRTLACQRGSITVLFAFSLIAILGMCGLVVDIGYLSYQKTRLQNAVDSAALAGASELPNTASAVTKALEYATDNHRPLTAADITFANNNNRIIISHTNNVNTFFMAFFGRKTVPVAATAAADLTGPSGPFNYAIFSGSQTADLNITGGGWTTKGSVHTNSNLILNGGGFAITGAAEAAKNVTVIGGGYQIGSTANHAGVIAMPDFTSQINAAAAAAGQVYTGNKTINGGGFTINGSMYVKGSLNITGGGFAGSGAIMSDGDMTINGGGITISGNDQVCFYSRNGNITFNGGGAAFNGVLYAPNGTITINGGGITFNGAIVANQVVLTGGGISVDRTDYPIKSLPSSVKLTQ